MLCVVVVCSARKAQQRTLYRLWYRAVFVQAHDALSWRAVTQHSLLIKPAPPRVPVHLSMGINRVASLSIPVILIKLKIRFWYPSPLPALSLTRSLSRFSQSHERGQRSSTHSRQWPRVHARVVRTHTVCQETTAMVLRRRTAQESSVPFVVVAVVVEPSTTSAATAAVCFLFFVEHVEPRIPGNESKEKQEKEQV